MANVQILGVASSLAGQVIPLQQLAGAPKVLVASFEFQDVSDPAAVARAMQLLGCSLADGQIDPGEAAALAVIIWPELGADGSRVVAVVEAVRQVVAGLEDDGKLSGGEILQIVFDLLRGVGGRAIGLEDLGRWALQTVRGLLQRRK